MKPVDFLRGFVAGAVVVLFYLAVGFAESQPSVASRWPLELGFATLLVLTIWRGASAWMRVKRATSVVVAVALFLAGGAIGYGGMYLLSAVMMVGRFR